jgi:hypothetical protein
VLAAIDMNLAASSPSTATVTLTQFFATGQAARNVAIRPDIRAYFGAQASTAVQQASSAAVAAILSQRQSDYEKIAAYFAPISTSAFAAARDRLLAAAGIAGDPLYGAKLRVTTNSTEFLGYVHEEPGLIGRLAPFVTQLSTH